MGKLHYITYSNGINRVTKEPYLNGQKILTQSIQSNTKKIVEFHTHTLETIQEKNWFFNLSEIFVEKDEWGRDGYFNIWKAFLTKEVFDNMNDDDILYYTDSSTYFKEPFQQNLDRLFDYVESNGHVCGSVGNDFKHNSFGCCDNPNVWKHIWDTCDYNTIVTKPHILNSWFLFKKNEINKKFIDDWCRYSVAKLNGKALCTYHHTVDQSIFNILVYKYGMKVFFNNTHHDHNKNHNNIHRQLNLESDGNIESISKWFYNPNNL